jgi:hypothetical protein
MLHHIYGYDENNDDPDKRVQYLGTRETYPEAVQWAGQCWDPARWDQVTVESENATYPDKLELTYIYTKREVW